MVSDSLDIEDTRPLGALVLPPERLLAEAGLVDKVEYVLAALGAQRQGRGKAAVEDGPGDVFPVDHTFTPGMYVRTIHMPRGAVLTSRTHLTEHPFVVSGRCAVYTPDAGAWEIIEAREGLYQGVTRPGTRRVLAILEDTTWATYHVTALTDVGEIEDAILAPFENPLLTKGLD